MEFLICPIVLLAPVWLEEKYAEIIQEPTARLDHRWGGPSGLRLQMNQTVREMFEARLGNNSFDFDLSTKWDKPDSIRLN